MVPQIVEQAVDGVAGQTTYRLNLRLGPRAENVYTIYGSSSGGTATLRSSAGGCCSAAAGPQQL